MSNKPKVLVIGLDGATYTSLKPLMDKGRLPTLSKLMAEGTSARLRSIFPPITAPAWASFMTGMNPGKTGIYEFLYRERDSHRRTPVSSRLLGAKTLWALLSDAGRKVGVMHVPLTYPPEKVNGFIFADFLTPAGKRDFSYPPELVAEVEAKYGEFPLYVRQVYYPGNVKNVLDELYYFQDHHEKVALDLIANHEWDFFMVHFAGIDRLQHEVWHIVETDHPMSKKKELDEFRAQTLGFYERSDESVRKLVEAAGEDVTVIVMSDHGFGPIRRFVNMNMWLLDNGYLKLKGDIVTRFKTVIFRLGLTPAFMYRIAMRFGFANLRLSQGMSKRNNLLSMIEKVFLSLQNVDWSQSKAYSRGNYGQIYVNLAGREAEGSVSPEEFDAVVESIQRDLMGMVDPGSGQPVVERVLLSGDIYNGPYSDMAPDISFEMTDGYKALGTLDFSSNRVVEPSFGNSGDHRMDGIFITAGPDIRAGHVVEGAEIIDLTPTILYHLGAPVPKEQDGKILLDVFTKEYSDRNKPRYSDESVITQRDETPYSDEEAAELERRLKDLGYLG